MRYVGIYFIIPFVIIAELLTDCLRQLWLIGMEAIGVFMYVIFFRFLFKGWDTVKASMHFFLADVFDYDQNIMLFRNVILLNNHFLFSSVITTISILSVVFFIWRIHLLRKRTDEIIMEQEFLVNDLEKTILELEEAKEESFQHQLFMRRLSVVLTHDLQSPFRFLITNTEALHDLILNKDYKDSEVLSMELKRAGEKALRFLMDFTIWMKSMSNGYKLRLETVRLMDVFTEMELFFAEQMKSKKNAFHYHVPDEISIVTDKELFKIILRNIVDNANKHCEQGIIKMVATKEDGHYNLLISDNGKGMPQATLDRIKELTNNHKPYHICAESDERQGYKFITHFSKLLQMQLEISSESLIGTSVRLTGLTIAE